MIHRNAVRLEPIGRSNWRATLDVRVTDDQMRFVADHQPISLVILAKSYVEAGGYTWEPMAIIAGISDVVGIVGIARDGSCAIIANLAIDERRQRAGLGAAAVSAIVDHCSANGCSEITLTVHPHNDAALRLYESAGFAPTGGVRDDEPEWRLALDTLRGPGDVSDTLRDPR